MLANYHTHTPRCGHAVGDERSYAEAALRQGFSILGFSDHAPYAYPDGYRSRIRMAPEETEDYCATVLALRQEYSGRLDIHLGVEAEYFPQQIDELVARLRNYGCEYMILGQHYFPSETEGRYAGFPTDDPALLREYTEQVIAGVETGLFTYVAHPDLLNWQGDVTHYRNAMGSLCEVCRDRGIPVEINLGGMSDDRHYPCPAFWRIAGDVGCLGIIGWDAHAPSELAVPALAAAARDLADACHVDLLDTVSLRPI